MRSPGRSPRDSSECRMRRTLRQSASYVNAPSADTMAVAWGVCVANQRSGPSRRGLMVVLVARRASDDPLEGVMACLVGKPIPDLGECNHIPARVAGLDADAHPILARTVVMLAFYFGRGRHALSHLDGLGKLGFNEAYG